MRDGSWSCGVVAHGRGLGVREEASHGLWGSESWVAEPLIVIKTSWVNTVGRGLLVVGGSGIVYSCNARLRVKWPRCSICEGYLIGPLCRSPGSLPSTDALLLAATEPTAAANQDRAGGLHQRQDDPVQPQHADRRAGRAAALRRRVGVPQGEADSRSVTCHRCSKMFLWTGNDTQ